MSSPEPLCGALVGFILARFLIFWIIANRFLKYRAARTSRPEYSRSREEIERLANLECMDYNAMTLFPYSDESFSGYQSASTQETHFGIGKEIHASIIFSSFVEKLETIKMHAFLLKQLNVIFYRTLKITKSCKLVHI